MDGWAYVAGLNALTSGVVIVAVKVMINSTVKRFEKQADLEREDRIRVDADIWSAFNEHGHKGFSGNNARVTK